MPDKWPLANGNWSSAANWNGGTKPLPGDDVYADGRTVAIDEDITVASLRTTQRSGGTGGGGFTVSTNRQIVANIIAGAFANANVVSVGAVNCVITGNLTAGLSVATANCVLATGNATITINGNVSGPATTSPGGSHAVNLGATASTLNVVGNLTSGNVDGSSGSHAAVACTGPAQISVVGNVTCAGRGGGGAAGIFASGSASIVITGNVIGSDIGTFRTDSAGIVATNSTVVSNGNLLGGATSFAVSASKIVANGGILQSSSGRMPISYTTLVVSSSSQLTHEYRTDGAGGSIGPARSLYTGGVNLGQPIPANVRFGTQFGVSNEYTGTLRVPAPEYVSQGVLTDATVGTLEFDLSPVVTAIENIVINPTPVTVNPTPVTVNPTPVTVNPTPVTVNPTPVTVNPTPVTVAVSIPAIEAESIVLDQEVTKYRGTLWSFTVEGLVAIPTKAYWTIKRSTETDAKAALQVVANNPTASGDGLKILNAVAVASGEASRGSISYETYTVGGNTRYRAILRLLPTASAAIIPDLYKLDLKDVTSEADAVLAECVLRVVNPVTLATS